MRISTALATVVAGGFLAAGAAEAQERYTYLHHSTPTNVFWQAVKKGMDEACEQIGADCQMVFLQQDGNFQEQLNNLNAAIAQQPDLFKYEKRCAAYAEVGRYRDALNDAQFILDHSDGQSRGSALMRVKALKDFMRRTDNFEAGYHNATSTLICLLRPREMRQYVR